MVFARPPQCTARHPLTTRPQIRLLADMGPRRRGLAPRGAAPRRSNILARRVKDHCPTAIVRTARNGLVTKRTWTDRMAQYVDNVEFSGPPPGYVGSCDSESKEISYFMELFGEAAKFMLVTTNRHIRRHRAKVENAVS